MRFGFLFLSTILGICLMSISAEATHIFRSHLHRAFLLHRPAAVLSFDMTAQINRDSSNHSPKDLHGIPPESDTNRRSPKRLPKLTVASGKEARTYLKTVCKKVGLDYSQATHIPDNDAALALTIFDPGDIVFEQAIIDQLTKFAPYKNFEIVAIPAKKDRHPWRSILFLGTHASINAMEGTDGFILAVLANIP